MLAHAQHVLGLEIVFMLDSSDKECIQMHNVASIELGKKRSSNTSSSVPAMLFPRGSELYSLYTDKNGIAFVRTNDEDRLFFLQEQWTELQHIICNDSIALAVVYRNKQEQLVMGIYDLLRASGVSYEDHNIFHRQKCLFSMFSQKTTSAPITAHWVGEEASLHQHMSNSAFLQTLPFDMDYMLRINEAAGQKTKYNFVLRPLLIPSPLKYCDSLPKN